MAFSNNMTKLLNKIELRLGLKILMPYLPESLAKDTWVDVIRDDTIVEFSRYFPNKVRYHIDNDTPKKGDYYLIDEDLLDGVEILGVQDLAWDSFTNDTLFHAQEVGNGFNDIVAMQSCLNMEDIAVLQMRRDIGSLFNNGIYIDFKAPNMFKLMMATNSRLGLNLKKFDVMLLIKHSDTLLTISPTLMGLFERLAISDVAGYLYRNLKYYDGLETIYATIDLKLDELQDYMNRRDSIIDEMRESYVSASNEACPVIMTI